MPDRILDESANLKRLKEFIEDINATNSSLDKAEKLKKYADDEYIKKALLYTYDPFRKYYLTVANLEKNNTMLEPAGITGIFELLDDLNARKYTGHSAIGRVNSFITDQFMYTDVIHAMLDRNLKMRLDRNEINKVFPGLIPTFDVVLAKTFEKSMTEPDKKGKIKVDFAKITWYGSRKLDGCRCVCIINEYGLVQFFSRQGNEFLTLAVLKKEIESWGLRSVVFDGELCIVDGAGNEDFKSIMQQINKKNHTIINPKYNLFDMLTLEEFRAGKGTVNFGVRIENLKAAVKAGQAISGNTVLVSALAQGRIQSVDHLNKLVELASKNGWEGLMLRNDVPYEAGRIIDLLKVKQMQDAEYEVVGVKFGMITTTYYRDMVSGVDVEMNEGVWERVDGHNQTILPDQVQSYSDTREMVSNLTIMHKGNPVDVGSGLSMAERAKWHKDISLIMHKIITVQYFQESADDTGKLSLRFPVLKTVHGDSRKV